MFHLRAPTWKWQIYTTHGIDVSLLWIKFVLLHCRYLETDDVISPDRSRLLGSDIYRRFCCLHLLYCNSQPCWPQCQMGLEKGTPVLQHSLPVLSPMWLWALQEAERWECGTAAPSRKALCCSRASLQKKPAGLQTVPGGIQPCSAALLISDMRTHWEVSNVIAPCDLCCLNTPGPKCLADCFKPPSSSLPLLYLCLIFGEGFKYDKAKDCSLWHRYKYLCNQCPPLVTHGWLLSAQEANVGMQEQSLVFSFG